MAIEPLGSMMSIQAQGTTVSKNASTEKVAATPENAVQPVQAIDTTTPIVENVQSKGQNNQGEQSKEQASKEQIRKAVENLNKKMEHSEAVFGIHDDTNRVTIKIVDKDTKEVIKELPPEKTLDMIARVWEMAGILVDERR